VQPRSPDPIASVVNADAHRADRMGPGSAWSRPKNGRVTPADRRFADSP